MSTPPPPRRRRPPPPPPTPPQKLLARSAAVSDQSPVPVQDVPVGFIWQVSLYIYIHTHDIYYVHTHHVTVAVVTAL